VKRAGYRSPGLRRPTTPLYVYTTTTTGRLSRLRLFRLGTRLTRLRADMAPKEQEKKGGLTLEKLISYDDVITDALVDKVGTGLPRCAGRSRMSGDPSG
jgi:hypothetical protein